MKTPKRKLVNLGFLTFVVCLQIWNSIEYFMRDEYRAAFYGVFIILMFFLVEKSYAQSNRLLDKLVDVTYEYRKMNNFYSGFEEGARRQLKEKDQRIAQLERGLNTAMIMNEAGTTKTEATNDKPET